MSIATSIAKIGEVFAIWLNPERREKARLRGAINAADNLVQIYRAMLKKPNAGVYSVWPPMKLEDYEKHYTKQFEAWKK